MSYLQEKIDVEQYFLDNWVDTPVAFENCSMAEAVEWVRLTVLNGDSKQVTMGDDPAFRHYGVVMVQVVIRPDVGSGRALELADKVNSLFINKVLGNLQFRIPQIKRGPQSPEWYQLNVSIDFYRGF